MAGSGLHAMTDGSAPTSADPNRSCRDECARGAASTYRNDVLSAHQWGHQPGARETTASGRHYMSGATPSYSCPSSLLAGRHLPAGVAQSSGAVGPERMSS